MPPAWQACVSNGLSCDAPLAFMPRASSTVGPIPRCRGAGSGEQGAGSAVEAGLYPTFYPTSRPPDRTWGDVAVESVASLATWIASLPPDDASVISALQIANEPALNSPGHSP